MIGSICLPSTPPALLISSMARTSAFFTATSLIDIVPLSDCRTPTLTVLASVWVPPPLLLEVVSSSLPQAARSNPATATPAMRVLGANRLPIL